MQPWFSRISALGLNAYLPLFAKMVKQYDIWWPILHHFLTWKFISGMKWKLEDKAWWPAQSKINSRHYGSSIIKSLWFCLSHTHKIQQKWLKDIAHVLCCWEKLRHSDSLLASVYKPCFKLLSSPLYILGCLKWMKCIGKCGGLLQLYVYGTHRIFTVKYIQLNYFIFWMYCIYILHHNCVLSNKYNHNKNVKGILS